jgi:hypothetical protein
MSTLIFTVAQNGYGVGYAKCLASHARYAQRLGATYVAVTRPYRVAEPALCAWLKISLLLQALRAGHDWVAFVDADCMIRECAPDFRIACTSSRSVYMAKGRSDRINSGVIFARGDAKAVLFFQQVMQSLTANIPAEARLNLKYENGNVIYCASLGPFVEVIPHVWNNTFEPTLDDHFRHFTGPMRDEYRRSWPAKLAFRIARSLAARPTSQPEARDAQFVARLEAITRRCMEIYPQFANAPWPQPRATRRTDYSTAESRDAV